jgi:xanthine dehydrogenase accessory factor
VEDLLDDLDRWRREELRVAIARVVEIDGSEPSEPSERSQQPELAASMAINERGEVIGSVSAACAEGAVVAAALEVLRNGRARLVSFGHSGDQAFSVGLAAGGTIHVLLEPLEW